MDIQSSTSSTSHPERTAGQQRQSSLHNASISFISHITPRVRLIRLALPYAINFLPGQWLDLHIPSLPNNIGGFTITSPPSLAQQPPSSSPSSPSASPSPIFQTPFSRSPSPSSPNQPPSPHKLPLLATRSRSQSPTSTSTFSQNALQPPYLELAVQYAPANPPAAWLWRPMKEIMRQRVQVRIGGSFVWPPWKAKGGEGIKEGSVKRVVFVAGGVGVNPFTSILTHLSLQSPSSIPETIKLLYSSRVFISNADKEKRLTIPKLNEGVLFLPQLTHIFETWNDPETTTAKSTSQSESSSDNRSPSTSPPSSLSPKPTSTSSSPSPSPSTSSKSPPSSLSKLPVYSSPNKSAVMNLTSLPDTALLPRRHKWLKGIQFMKGHIEYKVLRRMLGPRKGRKDAVVYVCGPKGMVDEVYRWLDDEKRGGMGGRVLVERWW